MYELHIAEQAACQSIADFWSADIISYDSIGVILYATYVWLIPFLVSFFPSFDDRITNKNVIDCVNDLTGQRMSFNVIDLLNVKIEHLMNQSGYEKVLPDYFIFDFITRNP